MKKATTKRMSIERPEHAYLILVEDDPNSYLIAEELLKHAGFTNLYRRGNAAKLIPLIDVLPQVDLVLLDINLPGENGFDVIKRLRQHPKTATTHIAAITANIMHESRMRAKSVGFDSFISKPIRPDRFCDQVRSMLAGKSLWW